jgi:MFS family permease
MSHPAFNSPEARKKTLYILSLALFISLIGIGIVVPFLSIFAGDFGAAGVWVGAVFSAFALSRTLAMPYFGRLSDRIEKKRIIIAGLAGYAVISIGYIFVSSIEGLVVVRLLHGLSSAMIAPVAMAYLGELAVPGEEGQFMGVFQGVTMLGFGAGPMLGGFIYAQYGSNEAFYALTGFSAIACIIVTVLLAPMPPKKALHTEKTVKSKKEKNVFSEYRMLLSDSRILAVCFLAFVFEIAFIAFLNFLPIFTDSLSLGAAESGFILGLTIVLSGILQSLFGRIANSPRRAYLIVGGGVILGIGYLLISLCTNFTFTLVISICTALGLFLTTPAMNVYLIDAGREFGMGATMGVYNTIRGCGDIIGPLLAGSLLDIVGVTRMYGVMGIFCLIGTIIFIVLLFGGAKKKAKHTV